MPSKENSHCCAVHALHTRGARAAPHYLVAKPGQVIIMYNSSDVFLGQLTSLCMISALIGLLPAAIAYNKGYSFLGWWFFGAALFILALPAAIMTKPNIEALEQRQLQRGMVKCPYCLELIKEGAQICKHCGSTLEVDSVQAQPVASASGLVPLNAEGKRICPACGFANSAYRGVCHQCGTRLLASSKQDSGEHNAQERSKSQRLDWGVIVPVGIFIVIFLVIALSMVLFAILPVLPGN